MTATPFDSIPPLRCPEAPALAAVENERFVDLVRTLEPEDWTKPTDCPAWDVRAMAAHVLGGMEANASMREWIHAFWAGKKAAGDGPFVDGLTAVQVRERAHLTITELVERLGRVAAKAARARGRTPALVRRIPLRETVGGVPETWRVGWLLDVILTRDTWMHRVDICRATGKAMVLTANHDGRIVAEIAAEWARRHGKSCTLTLEGPAGGLYTSGPGEHITIDAVEFCRILSGRATGTGLLTQPVPF